MRRVKTLEYWGSQSKILEIISLIIVIRRASPSHLHSPGDPPYIQCVHVCRLYFRKTSGRLPGNFREYVTPCYEARFDLLLRVFYGCSILYNAFSLIFNTFSRLARLLIIMMTKLLPVNFRIASGNFRGPQNIHRAKNLIKHTSLPLPHSFRELPGQLKNCMEFKVISKARRVTEQIPSLFLFPNASYINL